MTVAGLQKLTLLDFPGKLACTVFVSGCNFRCPFCYNAPLVFGEKEACLNLCEEEFFAFLKSRQGILEGVCITGGEPLLYDLEDFIFRIRALGFAVKLDTNGSFPEKLGDLIEKRLLDYVAMDVKNALSRYGETVGILDFDTEKVKESIELLKRGSVPYEFRTTVCREFHTEAEFCELAKLVDGAERYFIQNYNPEGVHIGKELTPYNKEELESFLPLFEDRVKRVELRGM
ncbi:MAG: anaerobic ribonucleoside-triphosphate reductase activating protein [Clostridia bacterium]|nr:anaerobic ribonucleoside-triphosphate reductase activating protein [Clostridia bacterium]